MAALLRDAMNAQSVVDAFEARARCVMATAERVDTTMVHRGDRALFRMLGASAHHQARVAGCQV